MTVPSLAERLRDTASYLAQNSDDHISVSDTAGALFDIARELDGSTGAVETTRHTQQSSVSIDRTSTGKYSISVKVYDDDPEVARLRTIELIHATERDLGMPLVDGGAS